MFFIFGGWASRGPDCLPLTAKLTSHYKADYVKLRGTLLDPFSSGKDSASIYVVLIIRKIESATVQTPNWMPFLLFLSYFSCALYLSRISPGTHHHKQTPISFPDKSISQRVGAIKHTEPVKNTYSLSVMKTRSWLSLCDAVSLEPMQWAGQFARCYDRLGTHFLSFSWSEIWYHVRNTNYNPTSGWHMAYSDGESATLHASGTRIPTHLQGSPENK